jgi:hypothetical protein
MPKLEVMKNTKRKEQIKSNENKRTYRRVITKKKLYFKSEY